MTTIPTDTDITNRILLLTQNRFYKSGGSLCPSEIARSFYTNRLQWSALMPQVRECSYKLSNTTQKDGGKLVCLQRGNEIEDPRKAKGPIRLKWKI
jgi:hypothetical protein